MITIWLWTKRDYSLRTRQVFSVRRSYYYRLYLWSNDESETLKGLYELWTFLRVLTISCKFKHKCQEITTNNNLSVYLSVCLSVCLPACLYVCLSVCISGYVISDSVRSTESGNYFPAISIWYLAAMTAYIRPELREKISFRVNNNNREHQLLKLLDFNDATK